MNLDYENGYLAGWDGAVYAQEDTIEYLRSELAAQTQKNHAKTERLARIEKTVVKLRRENKVLQNKLALANEDNNRLCSYAEIAEVRKITLDAQTSELCQLQAAVHALIEAEQSEGKAQSGFGVRTDSREHQRRVLLAWQQLHSALKD